MLARSEPVAGIDLPCGLLMVTPLSLFGIAAGFAALAAAVALWRRLDRRDAARDAGCAMFAALGLLVSAEALFALGWRDAGSFALLASPLIVTAALRRRGRRSIPRALLASVAALGAVVVWLTLNLKGPLAAWSAGEVAVVTLFAAVALSSAACLGWWSKPARAGRSSGPRRRETGPAEGA